MTWKRGPGDPVGKESSLVYNKDDSVAQIACSSKANSQAVLLVPPWLSLSSSSLPNSSF